jgi:hypothetical protein
MKPGWCGFTPSDQWMDEMDPGMTRDIKRMILRGATL